jgi:hypothetical protein
VHTSNEGLKVEFGNHAPKEVVDDYIAIIYEKEEAEATLCMEEIERKKRTSKFAAIGGETL